MDFSHFIARRLVADDGKGSAGFSRPIVFIAVAGVVIGMAVMILTVGISTGFQREVRAKVTGAGSHIEIVSIGQSDFKDSPRVPIDQTFYPELDTAAGVKRISVFAVKPGIVETDEEIQGVVVKGIGADHDQTFLKAHLVSGQVLTFPDTGYATTLISSWLAHRLRQGVGDTVTIYLVRGRDEIRPRRFRIKGIYETGIEKIDHQIVFVDIAHVQRFAQWGLQAELNVLDSNTSAGLLIEAMAFGGDRSYTYEWPGLPWRDKGPHLLTATGDTTVRVIIGDMDRTIPDTSWVRIRAVQRTSTTSLLTRNDVTLERGGSAGSYDKYCGGFEVALTDHRLMEEVDDRIYRDYLGPELRTITAKEKFPEIFAWLELLDTNVVVVIVLMTIVAVINMASALLIIILERTNMIGVLKALGSNNASIRRIFLIDAAYIIGAGILAGDLLGIGLGLLQKHLGLVHLPIESYYVDTVPVDLELLPIALLNAGVMAVCVLALVLPSMYVSRIAPARAIRFE